MLSFAYVYCEAYNQVTANKDMKIRKYELSRKEWKIVKDLADVLKVCYMFVDFNYLTMMLTISQIFKDATLFFSRSTPNLAKVIPAMDHIDKHLTTACIDAKYDPAIQAALAVGKQLLNKYYPLTDSSELY